LHWGFDSQESASIGYGCGVHIFMNNLPEHSLPMFQNAVMVIVCISPKTDRNAQSAMSTSLGLRVLLLLDLDIQ